MVVKDSIIELYSKISEDDAKKQHVAQLYYSIIQLKQRHPEYTNIKFTLYQDAKSFINYQTASLDSRDIGYDVMPLKKIKSVINKFDNVNEKYHLATYTQRILRKDEFEAEATKFNKYTNELKTKVILSEDYHFCKYGKLLLHLSTYNIFTIFIALIIVFLFSYVILLPTTNPNFQIFTVTYDKFSNNFLLNHLSNLLASIFGLTSSFSVKANNLYGVLLLAILKSFYVVFIINYLYQKIIDLLKTN